MLADFFGYKGYQKSYALVVGISAYSGGYRSLPTQNDPLRMRDFLLDEAGFDYVHVLTDEKVTYARLRTLMEEKFPDRVKANDRFLFYWSGHGTQRKNPEGKLLGYLPLAPSSLDGYGSMVRMGDIERWDWNIAAKQALYLIDACFSGLAGAVTQSDRRALTKEQLAQPSRHLMVAGTGDEPTIAGDQWGGSLFTDSVLKGLWGEADAASAYGRDGLVSLNELIDYVSKPDYEDWERIIDLQAGAEEVLWAKLVRLSKPSITSHSQVERPSAARPQPKEPWQDPATGMEFVWVPEGCFRRRSNEGRSNGKVVHEVCVDGFWMGKYEVTQGQWEKVAGNNPSYFKVGDRYPVETVSWDDVQAFIGKLNARGQDGFRLPSEAEWEYACRSGGKQEKYCGGNDVNRVAWYIKNSGGKTHPVGIKAANGLGLYDMSGNVWEWVSDWYDYSYYYKSPKNNPKGPSNGSLRVIRGGGWHAGAGGCRSACRYDVIPGHRRRSLGFRLARTHP